MKTLSDSYFYSVLYYNVTVWLTMDLKCQLKQDLLSVSANALKSCLWLGHDMISFHDLRKINSKCSPNQIAMYQRSLTLYRAVNAEVITFEIVTVLNQMVCTRRQVKFEILRDIKSKIGLSTLANKLYPLNGKIGLDFLNFGQKTGASKMAYIRTPVRVRN